MTDSRREIASLLGGVRACYFLSGALGLIYQVLWLRKLLLVFGSTVHAVSTVLTVFFAGLALGSWWFGRLIDRGRLGSGLRWYAALEVGVGLYAFITPPLFEAIRHLYIPVYRASGMSPAALIGASFVCSALVLLAPTTLLGGTFPVLSRFLIRSGEERGARIADLYGINAAGAMAGVLFMYHLGLPMLGVARTLACAGVLNVGIGLLCALFDRHLGRLGFSSPHGASPPPRRLPTEEAPEASRTDVRWLFAAFALSGFSAMAYEVAWTRALGLVLGSSTYAFCVVLATFLGGMALGSLGVRSALHRRPATTRQFVLAEFALGGCGLLSVLLVNALPDLFVALWPATAQSFSGLLWLQFILSALVMAAPTALMGALFPIVSDLATRRFRQLGQRLGACYAVNTLGGILGSFLAGFALIPSWGLPWAIVAAAVVNVIAGSVLFVRFGEGAPVPRLVAGGIAPLATVLLGAHLVVPAWQRHVLVSGAYLNPSAFSGRPVREGLGGARLLYYRDSFNATVSVHQDAGTTFLKIGGKTDASTGIDMATQALAAHVPMLLHRDPKRVLVIGLGSGVTLGHAARHPVSVAHCAELDPAVIEASRYFSDHNYRVHDDPRVAIYPADGRNFLLAAIERYDVIISEPSNPWMAGVAHLFTKEFYALARARLAPGGIMCQWLQLYGIVPGDVKLMLKTFHEVFPHISVWSSIPGDLLLVGSLEPHALDRPRLAERMARAELREALRTVRMERPELFPQLFWLGAPEVEQVTSDIFWTHEDDQPTIEFNAPRSLYTAGLTLAVNYPGLAQFRAAPDAIAAGDGTPRADAALQRALAAMWSFRQEDDKALDALEQAAGLEPSSVETWMQLGETALRMRLAVRAREAFLSALALEPSHLRAHRLLAQLEQAEGRRDEARARYEQAALLGPPDREFAAELAAFYGTTGQLPLAVEYYRSAVSQGAGDDPSLLRRYGAALLELKSWEAAEQVLRHAAGRFGSQGAFASFLGQALAEQARWEEAVAWFTLAAELLPRNAEAQFGLGRAALALGDAPRAVRHLRQALRYEPYHHKALQLLSRVQRGQVL
jgi:spermidine synthase